MAKKASKRCLVGIRLSPVTLAVAAALGSSYSAPIQAQALEEITVTATRRANTVQNVPINITAISGDELRSQRLVALDEIARVVPGLQVIDRGPRDEFTDILARGLNTSSLGIGFNGVSVASYLGEVPLPVDLKTNDLERVEVLMGPQGTLYGAGTLGGAVRYIPTKPQDEFEASFRGNVFSLDHSDDLGSDIGLTVNVPLGNSNFALRASVDQLSDPGYIDYNYVVREPGVSDPDPDFSNPTDVAANLRRVEDANGEETLSARLGLRWTPTDAVDATLWYYYQDVEAEGRGLANVESFDSDPYASAFRYEEPNNYRSDLVALEVVADLGFAELTSATGLANYDEIGQRDQTDLLLSFGFGYELFPTFSAFTRDIDDTDTTTQEFRLVSNNDGRLNWIGGFFYSDYHSINSSEEFTPGFDQFAVDNFGGVQLRPDALEYIALDDTEIKEKALYGELSYAFADDWEVTLGARLYDFERNTTTGFGLPLYYTVFFGYPQDFIEPIFTTNNTQDDGSLLKFNLAHNFSSDVLGYFTASEGYRLGGLNTVPECTPAQLVQIEMGAQPPCASVDEILIKADTTMNYELGVHSTLAGGRAVVNAAVFFIDWEDIQVDTVTSSGSVPITSNGGTAQSKGLELSASWQINPSWFLSGTYAYIQAELTQATAGLLGDSLVGDLETPDGSRLPGSPENQASVALNYSRSLRNGMLFDLRYGLTYTGDILNSIGVGLESTAPWQGEALPSYTLHSLTVGISADQWTAALYVDNLTDEYVISGTRASQRLLGLSPGGVPLRSYSRYIGRPRTVGLSINYTF